MLATGKKCEAVSPETIKLFMQELIEKGISFAWEALQIYIYYTEEPEKKKKLLPALYVLLTKDKLLSDKNRYSSMDDHYYKEAVKDILNSEYGEPFSQKFLSQISNSKKSLFDFSISDSTIRECCGKIIQKYPDRLLQEIISNTNNSNLDFIFNDKTSFEHHPVSDRRSSPLSCLTEDILKAWCKKAPDKIPIFLAKNMNLFLNDRLSPSAKFLLDEYGGQQKLTEAISLNLGNFSWTGDLSIYFEKTKKALKELTDHKHKNVRDFAVREISYLNKQIEGYRQREKEREEFNIY